MRKKEVNPKQKVTLSINSEIYNNFKKHCEEKALKLSKKIELFMKAMLEEAEDDQ